MAGRKLPNNNMQLIVPDYSQEYLVNKLKETDLSLLPRLYSIYIGRVIFTGILHITVDKETKHRYLVTISIPLTSDLLVKYEEFSTIFPSMINENNTFFRYCGLH